VHTARFGRRQSVIGSMSLDRPAYAARRVRDDKTVTAATVGYRGDVTTGRAHEGQPNVGRGGHARKAGVLICDEVALRIQVDVDIGFVVGQRLPGGTLVADQVCAPPEGASLDADLQAAFIVHSEVIGATCRQQQTIQQLAKVYVIRCRAGGDILHARLVI